MNEDATPFRTATVLILLAVGLVGFAGMLLLGAFAPDLKSGQNGGAHALSNAATGFSGIVRLAEATGRHPQILHDTRSLKSEDLLVITPETGATQIGQIVGPRQGRPLLVVLPKWNTVSDADTKGWVDYRSLLPPFEPQGVLAPGWKLKVTRRRSGGRSLVSTADLPAGIRFTAPRPLQTINGADLTALITDGAGGIVVGRLGDGPLYVLADPDLLSNRGMAYAGNAASALALLDWMNSNQAQSIGFDVTLNGFGQSRSPLKLAFEPPFLPMTVAIVVAMLLAGAQALGRFGPVRPRARAIAFGKTALVDNAAALVRKAGREARLGGRYGEVIRERAVVAFGVPARLRDAALDAYLDNLGGPRRFTELVEAADTAGDIYALVAAARALHDWKWERRR